MDDISVNNGKDVKGLEVEEVNTVSGKHFSVKQEDLIKEPVYFEPKKGNRWVLKFLEDFKKIPQWANHKTHRPKLINGEWGDIEIIFYDAIGPSVTQALHEGFRLSWRERKRKIPIIKYHLEMLDPTGVTIEQWLIEGEVKLADFGDLNYNNDKIMKIKIIVESIKVILVY